MTGHLKTTKSSNKNSSTHVNLQFGSSVLLKLIYPTPLAVYHTNRLLRLLLHLVLAESLKKLLSTFYMMHLLSLLRLLAFMARYPLSVVFAKETLSAPLFNFAFDTVIRAKRKLPVLTILVFE